MPQTALVCLKYYIKMTIAYIDNTEALKDTKLLSESKNPIILSTVLMSLSQSSNTLTFGKPDTHPIM